MTHTQLAALETLAPSQPYPLIRASGSPYDRGVQIGSQARLRVLHTLRAYRELFAGYTPLSWEEVRRYAGVYESIIAEFDSTLVEEMRGVAAGSGVDFADVLTVNVRTEIMYGVGELRQAADCTAFAARGGATANGHTLLGQNWDWHPAAFESLIVLAIEQESAPCIVTVVEAGLLSKMGMNSAGVGVCTNAMVTDLDRGEPGIPYHVILRAIQNTSSVAEAATLVKSVRRASSANYLVADATGDVVDLEVAPGGPETVFTMHPQDDVIGHANCFVGPDARVNDQTAIRKPISITRQRTIDAKLQAALGKLTVEHMEGVMADHEHQPNSLCRHPIERFIPLDRSATVASVICDLDDLTFAVADGEPCARPYRQYTPAELWPGKA